MGCGAVAAVLDHGHLTEPLALSHMTKYNGGSANLAQDFDLASNEAQHVFSRAVLVEEYIPLPEFNPSCHRRSSQCANYRSGAAAALVMAAKDAAIRGFLASNSVVRRGPSR
jgi:hypothetical protein